MLKARAENCLVGQFGSSKEEATTVHARSQWALFICTVRDRLVFVLFKLGIVIALSSSLRTINMYLYPMNKIDGKRSQAAVVSNILSAHRHP